MFECNPALSMRLLAEVKRKLINLCTTVSHRISRCVLKWLGGETRNHNAWSCYVQQKWAKLFYHHVRQPNRWERQLEELEPWLRRVWCHVTASKTESRSLMQPNRACWDVGCLAAAALQQSHSKRKAFRTTSKYSHSWLHVTTLLSTVND